MTTPEFAHYKRSWTELQLEDDDTIIKDFDKRGQFDLSKLPQSLDRLQLSNAFKAM